MVISATKQLRRECMLNGGVLYCQVYNAMNEHPEAPTVGEVPKVKHPCASTVTALLLFIFHMHQTAPVHFKFSFKV